MNNTLRITAALCVLMEALSVAEAQEISESTASEVARSHFSSLLEQPSQQRRAPGRAQAEPRLAYTGLSESGKAFYVFNNDGGEGYVIVGADQIMKPVIGYCTEGSFDYDNMPDNMRWWLSQYQTEFDSLKLKKAVPAALHTQRKAPSRQARQSIPGLITTKWGQSYPYNCMVPLPEYQNYQHYLTGCVATAMAQVMNYHKYPVHGTGTFGYSPFIVWGGEVSHFEADFENTYYDWDNMKDSYSNGYTKAEAEAVGTLMYQAGVSVKMSYGYSASGAKSIDVAQGIARHFGYNKNTYMAVRSAYTNQDWEDLIYSELAAGRPLYYDGVDSEDNGHAFVCHGYDAETDMYLFNWGWNGVDDGYYSITGSYATDETGRYIDYHREQAALIDLRPDTGEEQILNYRATDFRFTFGDYGYYEDYYECIGPQWNTFADYDLSNYMTQKVPTGMETSIVYRDLATGEMTENSKKIDVYDEEENIFYYRVPYYFEYCGMDVIEHDGEYEVVPVARLKGQEKWSVLTSKYPLPRLRIIGVDGTKYSANVRLDGAEMEVRRHLTFSADNLYKGSFEYSSTDESIATVNDKGVVTGMSPGKTTIKVHVYGNSYFNEEDFEFPITVLPTDCMFDLELTTINLGEEVQIWRNANYKGNVVYQSLNTNVATVDANGFITGRNVGNAEINVINPATGEKWTFIVYVIPSGVDGLYLSDIYIMNDGIVTSNNSYINFWVQNVGREPIVNEYFGYIEDHGTTHYIYNVNLQPGEKRHYYIDLSWSVLNCNDSNPHTIRFQKERKLSAFDSEYLPMQVDGKDEFELYVYPEMSFSRTFSNWKTICMPFDYYITSKVTAYHVAGSVGNQLILEEVEDGLLKRNHSYVVSASSSVSTTFYGPELDNEYAASADGMLTGAVKEGVTIANGDYILARKNGDWGFYKATAEEIGTEVQKYTSIIRIDPNSDKFKQNDVFYLTLSMDADVNLDSSVDVGDIITIINQKLPTPKVEELKTLILNRP